MLRTVLAVVLSTLVVASSARAAEELAPSGTLLNAAPTTVVRVNTDLSASLNAAAVPSLNVAAFTPKRPTALTSMYVGLAGLQAFDVYSTMSALKAGAREANPVMSGVVGHPAAFVALKAGMTTMSIVAAEKMWRQGKRAQAIAVMAVSNGFMTFVAAHNASVVSGQR
jgi:hypothetical protein